MTGPAGRRGHGDRLPCGHWGLREGHLFRDQGFRAVLRAHREGRGRSSQRQHWPGSSGLDVIPRSPQASHTSSTSPKPAPPPVVAPSQIGLPSPPPPCSTTPPVQALGSPIRCPPQVPSLALGGELGRGEARGKRKGPPPARGSLATHPPQSQRRHFWDALLMI